MVTKAAIEDDFNESVNNTDTSIPIEPVPTNLQDNTLKINKNKYFKHCVTLSILLASLTLVSTNKPKNKLNYHHKFNLIYFYFRLREILSMKILIQYL